MSAEYPRDPAYREPIREREVIVTDSGRGPGGLIALLIGIAALALIVWLVVSSLGGAVSSDGGAGTMDMPEQVDVNIDQAPNG